MEAMLRILHLEDDPVDSAVVEQLLRRGGLSVELERVTTLEGFQCALEQGAYALILSDYSIPGVDALETFRLARQKQPQAPFIFVSGTIGEDLAIETLKQGAIDYVLKQRLERLVPAVRRALQEAEEQARRQQAEDALRQSEERFRTFFELAAVGLAQTELPGHTLIAVNDRFCQITGYSREELLGMSPSDLTHPEDRAGDRESLDRLFRGEIPEYMVEKRYVRKGGAVIWIQIAVTCVRDADAQPTRTVAILQDITERRQAAEALREANERLAEADRRKDEFLAMLAHELRNPLAPVRNAIEVLRMIGPQEPALQRQRDIIERQIRHMTRLIDDLLDVSRITRGRIELKKQPLELTDVLRHAVEINLPQIEARRQTLHFTAPTESLRLEGDPDRLAQAVGNLLANAAKFSNEGGQIWLEAGCEASGELMIQVRDTGVGIAPELLPQVFDVFVQADRSLDRARGGLGIGLTLVRRIVQLHGGSVEAHSDGLGQGSEFNIRLPSLCDEQADPASAQRLAADSMETSRCRILVVDDVADTAESMADLLRLFGHEVRTAYGGASALELAHDFRPHVILLDIGMPEMDGYEVARRLRQGAGGQRMRLVALSGYGQESDRQKGHEAGFDAHLVKPVDLDALKGLLNCATEIPAPKTDAERGSFGS